MILFCLKDLSITWETHTIDIEIHWNNPTSDKDTYAYIEIVKKEVPIVIGELIEIE